MCWAAAYLHRIVWWPTDGVLQSARGPEVVETPPHAWWQSVALAILYYLRCAIERLAPSKLSRLFERTSARTS